MKQTLLIILLASFYIYGYTQNCSCPDYEFSSSKDQPIIKISCGNNDLIVCGYHGVNLASGRKSGVFQKDSSVYLSGFNIFTCIDNFVPLASYGEINEYKLKSYRDHLTLDLMMNIPVDKELKYKNSSLIRYEIICHKNKWIINKPYIVLDFNSLTEDDFFKIKKDLGWDNLYPEFMFERNEEYPENRIMYAFVVALKFYPNYNQDFYNLGKFDGYLSELHEKLNGILQELKQLRCLTPGISNGGLLLVLRFAHCNIACVPGEVIALNLATAHTRKRWAPYLNSES